MTTMMIQESRKQNHEHCRNCCYGLPTRKDRQIARQRQRRIEKVQWKKEWNR